MWHGVDHYSGARLAVRCGVVVVERDAQSPAYVGQFCGVDMPQAPCENHCANKRQFRHADLGLTTAGCQHAPVKPRVVRHDELDVTKVRAQLRPELGETWLRFHRFPCYPVQIGEIEIGGSRSDQERLSRYDLILLNSDEADGTGAAWIMVGRFKINGKERSARLSQFFFEPAVHSVRH